MPGPRKFELGGQAQEAQRKIRDAKREQIKARYRERRIRKGVSRGGHSRTATGQMESARVQEKAARHGVRMSPRSADAAVNRRFRAEWHESQFGRGAATKSGIARAEEKAARTIAERLAQTQAMVESPKGVRGLGRLLKDIGGPIAKSPVGKTLIKRAAGPLGALLLLRDMITAPRDLAEAFQQRQKRTWDVET